MSPKFRKLLAAFADEVRRKQEKVLRKVAQTDTPMPNYERGYCPFVRDATKTVWSPSFDVLGTYDPAERHWVWGWADASVHPRVRGRIESSRTQGAEWGIEELTNGRFPLEHDSHAIELATVATAIIHADAVWSVLFEGRTQFLALFDGPPPNRSSTFHAFVTGDFTSPDQTPHPASRTSMPPTSQAAYSSRRSVSSPAVTPVGSYRPPADRRSTPSSVPPVQTPRAPGLRQDTPQPSVMPTNVARNETPLPRNYQTFSNEREPTAATRLEISTKIFEAIPQSIRDRVRNVQMLVRAIETSTHTLHLDAKIVVRSVDGDSSVPLTEPLHALLMSLWQRCRDREGDGFRFLTARMSVDEEGGLNTQVNLEL